MADVITSIGTANNTSASISSTSGSGPYTVTFAASLPADLGIGDELEDTNNDSFRVIGFPGGNNITVDDFDGVGAAPVNGMVTRLGRFYTTLAAWQADLNNSALYASGDTAIGEMHADSDFDLAGVLSMSLGSTVGLTNITLRAAPASSREDGATQIHTGVANTGVRILMSTNGGIRIEGGLNITGKLTFEDFEIDMNGKRPDASESVVYDNEADLESMPFQRMLVHGSANNGASTNRVILFELRNSSPIQNNIFYNFQMDAGGLGRYQYVLVASGAGQPYKCCNNTVHDVGMINGGSSVNYGISIQDAAGELIQNNIVTNVIGGLIAACYDKATTTTATVDHNAASDTTASGTGSIDNITVANQYVSTVVGSENLHIQDVDADIYFENNPGADLAESPAGVNFDIDNHDRHAGGTDWSIGADQGEEFAPPAGGGMLAIFGRSMDGGIGHHLHAAGFTGGIG